ncbi:M56 family metallopeptidase [Flavivirga jejuensis]|uniref:M56 family metallopeptidase n=1 Tax=Flavivirga jejuensis TaxID=870487 RepID=A0ABT8WIW5_9FLAO|nr:M56 family metallopeptidase [Flavivirga jejuensis]MDO5973101.1 M56 family metallopeptidase [Flavivirga jejuensis]
MVHYIINTIAFQLFFLIIYDLFLKKETFFNWNRTYLLVTSILSLIIPFIKINRFKEILPQEFIIMPEVIIGTNIPQTDVNMLQLDPVIITSESTWSWELLLYAGMILATFLFLFKITKLIMLFLKNPKSRMGNLLVVRLLKSCAAFSCFHYIFLGEQINKKDRVSILKHEMVHVKQRHTLDLLFFEVLRILFWFNPLIYMYQNRIMQLHEFIADNKALKHQSKKDYYENLLSQVFQTENISFINPFFKQSLIKKRIVMLQKSKSKQISLIKYALLIPVVLTMLIYTSSEAHNKAMISSSIWENQDLNDKELKEKLYKEILEIEKEGTSAYDILQYNKLDLEKYIVSRVDYYKDQMTKKYMLDKGEKPTKDLTKELNRTYKEYLEFKKTYEAKNIWEGNDTYDGSLRLVVNDFNNMTVEENEKYNKKKEQLHKNNFFTKLIVTDGKDSKTITGTSITNQNRTKDSNVEFDIPFSDINQSPIFIGCEMIEDKEAQKKCTSDALVKYIVSNFNTEKASKLGVKGKQRINVIFKIDKEGNVTGVRSRAAYPVLEKEAVRVINTLPKMIPGKRDGNNIEVSYTLPIIFQIRYDSVDKETIVSDQNQQDGINRKDKTKLYNENNTQMLDEIAIVGYSKNRSNLDIPFSVVDQIPVFSGCEDLSKEEQKDCTSRNISKHINKNFNTKIADSLNLKGRQRINVIFKINKKGNIVGIRSRAPHPVLKDEAIRVIKTLPKMIPGEHDGKKVNVSYSLPIIFQAQDTVESLSIKEETHREMSDVLSFSVVDQIPVFTGCEGLSKEEQKECTSRNISAYVNKNFDTKIADNFDLKGGQRINVIFKINKEGNIVDIRPRGSHQALEEEAIRVINTLPKMVPGEHDGKKVNVLYMLPIIFQVAE